MDVGILSILLNCHCQYNMHDIHDCLLMGWQHTYRPSCMCSTTIRRHHYYVKV